MATPTKRTGSPFALHRGSSMENVFGVHRGRDRLSDFDETEEMEEVDANNSEQKGETNASATVEGVEKQQPETSKPQESSANISDGETKTHLNVNAQNTSDKAISALTVSHDSNTDVISKHKPSAQSGLTQKSQESNQKSSETGSESLKTPAVRVESPNQASTSKETETQNKDTPNSVVAHSEDTAEESVHHKNTSPEAAAHSENVLQTAASDQNTSPEGTTAHNENTSEEAVAHKKVSLQQSVPHEKNTPERTTTSKELKAADTKREHSTLSDSGSQVKRPGSTGKANTGKQDKRDNTPDPKNAVRRKSSATSRSPRATDKRVARVSIDRSQKADDKTDEKVNKSNKPPYTSPQTTNNKTKKSEDEGKSQPATDKTTDPVEPRSQKEPSLTNKPTSATKPSGRQDAGPKTANGALPNNSKTKHGKPETKTKRDEQDQQKKAHALLSRAVMRRVASLENKSTDKPPPQPAPNDLNSSAGAKSLGGKSNSSIPHQPLLAHKTQSIQSLAVPGPGLGGSGLTDEDRVSLGSRRDSVSYKSVDYRLQASQAVVAAGSGGGEEKAKSVLMHDDSMIRAAIPALPVPMAVLCLMLNILLPGSGTMVSGLAMPCCGKSRLSSKGDGVAVTVCINLCVGAAQLGTVTFFLVGWFWALAWGVKMIILAVERREEQRQQREKELQALALRAFGSPGNVGRSILPPV